MTGVVAPPHPRAAFLRAARGLPTEYTPVWFMRQAGRTLPEYRKIRESYTLLEICANAELCAEVTLQPMRRMPIDAAVMFGDIMLPLVGAGIDLDIVENVGPVIREPIRTAEAVSRLRPLDSHSHLPAALHAVRLVRQSLEPHRAVLGFAGAPFTLASYLIEGRPTRDFVRTKTLMVNEPALWATLMSWLVEVVVDFLRANVDAGADALQLFDSWVGALSVDDYERYVRPWTQQVFARLHDLDVPLVHFGTGNSHLLDQLKDDGGTVIGLDWRLPLDRAWQRVGAHLGVQGNLDPALLHAPWSDVAAGASEVLRRAGGRPGHVFNLGHGLLPTTPVENIERLVDHVQQFRWRPDD